MEFFHTKLSVQEKQGIFARRTKSKTTFMYNMYGCFWMMKMYKTDKEVVGWEGMRKIKNKGRIDSSR